MRSFHVSRIALFGSYSRNEQTDKSDVDLLVEFNRPVGLFTLIELEDLLSNKIGIKVDLTTPDSLKAPIRPNVLRDAVYA